MNVFPSDGGPVYSVQPMDRTQNEFLAEPSWGAPAEPSPIEQTWTQKVVRMARGRVQIEGGYSYLRGPNGFGSQHAVPDMLLRMGLSDRLELRLGWPGVVFNDGGSTNTLDPTIGVVYDLWGQDGYRPLTAVHVALPVSMEGNPFALNSFQPLTEVMYSWQVSPWAAVTGRTGFALFDVFGDDYTQIQQSLSYDVVLTDRVGAFVSWEMLADIGSQDDTSQHMLGGGLSYLLSDRWAISWRSAFGVNEAAPDFLNDIRLAYRF
ncbi:transporter [Bremerella sp. P1]|uniref:transporter n=1 Tax=Bremerella sp. P1 TaxID=3026424 RepID=UPI002368C4C0|nr:transporter [Bremerella sp. P1]WDI43312.1 transporter [Bremerella sp. P1]